jgi:hypothetical protein
VSVLAACLGIFRCGAAPPNGRAAGREVEPADHHADVIVFGVSPERAAMIADQGIALRRQIMSIVLGEVECRPWLPPCMVHVHGGRAAFRRTVVGAPADVEGATSIEFLGDDVRSRRIDLVDPADGGIPGALAHELVHVVLADHFTDRPPPRWADEGLATLFDNPAKQRGHEADFRAAAARGQSWRLADLITMEVEPAAAARQRIFYGQSAALVRWLLARGDGPTFLRFLDDSDAEGVEAALLAHYGLASVGALEKAWLQTPVEVPAEPRVAGSSGRL